MVVILYTFCSFLSCLGDPAKLHIQIRDFDVDMQSLEELSLQELRALCEKSDIPVTSSKSQVSPVMNTFIFMFVNTFYTFQLSFPVDPFSTCFMYYSNRVLITFKSRQCKTRWLCDHLLWAIGGFHSLPLYPFPPKVDGSDLKV